MLPRKTTGGTNGSNPRFKLGTERRTRDKIVRNPGTIVMQGVGRWIIEPTRAIVRAAALSTPTEHGALESVQLEVMLTVDAF